MRPVTSDGVVAEGLCSRGGYADVSFLRSCFDRVVAAIGLLMCSPVLGIIAAALVFDDGKPVLFRQVRVGRRGIPFGLLKFRSMFNGRGGALLTASGDRRVTRVGRYLRKYKLDELPQLWNVLVGEMSLVGPRPEVPAYVDSADACWQAVLSVRPGLTDLATLLYRDEERILAEHSDPERAYRESILPAKLALNLEYLSKRSFVSDMNLLVLTVVLSFMPGAFNPLKVRKLILSDD